MGCLGDCFDMGLAILGFNLISAALAGFVIYIKLR